MLGAIIGDIVGSRFEFNNIYNKDFELFDKKCDFTDDTVLSLAVAYSFMRNVDVKKCFKKFTKTYPNRGYGSHFLSWVNSLSDEPYYSCGNGAPMRISPIAWLTQGLPQDVVDSIVDKYTSVTHNHPEGIKAARVQVKLIQLALKHKNKDIIYQEAIKHYEIPDKLYRVEFSELSQDTMPIAIKAFLDSTDFEDAIRNAISVGGDSDTIACITGAIAEAFYGIPEDIRIKALSYLPDFLFYVYAEFEKNINTQKITFNKKHLQHYMKLIEYKQNGILDEFLQNEEKIKIYLESVCD